jgi:hypothetical protein
VAILKLLYRVLRYERTRRTTYDFLAARGSQIYERFLQGTYLFIIQRQMTLEGRMNLIF